MKKVLKSDQKASGKQKVRPTQGAAKPAGGDDIREAMFNGQAVGPAFEIARPLAEVACINGFLIDIDCCLLNPAVVGQECIQSPDLLYDQHVRLWLDRDPVFSKAEVRNTGHGLHVLLMLDQPIICMGDENRRWDSIARGIRSALPGDPKLNGIIAMTRPVGAANTKHSPPLTVTQLRAGEPVTRDEILDLNSRLTEKPARLWMECFHGTERISPCPFCLKEGSSLGVAGDWKCQCYECGRLDASALVYHHYDPKFLNQMKGLNG